MPIVSIDWPKVKSKVAGQTVVVAMTDRQLAMINSLAIQLQWRKTWRVLGYDFSDWDTLLQEIDDLGVNLNMPVYLTDLLTALSDIKDAIDAVQSVQDYCCSDSDPTGGLQYTTPFTEGETGDVPANLISAGLASDANDWEGFNEYQCALAHLFVDNLKSKIDDMSTLFDYGGALIAGVGALATILTVFTGGSALLIAGVIVGTAGAAGLFSQLQNLGQAGLPDAQDIEDIRDYLVCAWTYDAHDGFDDRWAGWVDALHDSLGEPAAYFCEALSMKSTMRPFYAAEQGDRNLAQELVAQGFDPSTYVCDCIPSATCDANNELVDCGFESGELGNGWEQNLPANNAQFLTSDVYEGVYKMAAGGAGYGNFGYYIYQNFTASATGEVRIQAKQKFIAGIYNNCAQLFQGSTQIGSNHSLATTHDGQWNTWNSLTGWQVTQGVTYQLRYLWQYQYLDNIKLTIE